MIVVKSDRHTLMKEATLSDSLMIKLEGPNIKEFIPDAAINFWFNKCPRRPGTGGSQENKSTACEIIHFSKCSYQIISFLKECDKHF